MLYHLIGSRVSVTSCLALALLLFELSGFIGWNGYHSNLPYGYEYFRSRVNNSPFSLPSIVAESRIPPSVEAKLPAGIEVNLQASRIRPNILGHQKFAFSSHFSLMDYLT